MANGVNLVLVCFVSSDPRSEARDQPIQVVVEIHKKVIDSELEKKSDVLLPLMASYLAGYAALVAAASKRLAIAAGPLTWLSYAWLSIETWAAPPREPDYFDSTGNGISAWIVQPGDPRYPTSSPFGGFVN
jgi:hypothetical protein